MYNYKTERPKIFTEEGQREFLKVRDNVAKLLAVSGAVDMHNAIKVVTGDGWQRMAYVDRLVELEEIREIPQGGTRKPAGQDRIFVKA